MVEVLVDVAVDHTHLLALGWPECHCLTAPLPSFDVHQHLWPEQLIEVLVRRRSPPCLRNRKLELAGEGSFALDLSEHDLERRLRLLDRDEVEVALVSLQPTLGINELPEDERATLIAAYHEGIRELVSAAGGRLRAFAAGACLDDFAGACVAAPDLVSGGETFDALLRELAEREQVLFVHPGPVEKDPASPPWWPAVVDYTAQMQAAYAAWLARRAGGKQRPRVIFAILAGGAPIQLERFSSRGVSPQEALDPDVFLDAASYGRRALELCLATFGIRQLLYGSDVPVVDSLPTLQAVRSFDEAVADVILAENPTLLFG